MNKFLYKYIKWLYAILANIRISFYIFLGKINKAEKIITEHFKWDKKL